MKVFMLCVLLIFSTGLSLFGDASTSKKSLDKGIKFYENAKMSSFSGDYEKALALYKQSCFQEHYARSCSRIVMYYASRKATESDRDRALALGKKLCKNGDGVSCSKIAELYRRGIGIAHRSQNSNIATNLYKKGCSLKDGESCYFLGNVEYRNKRYKKALEKYKQGCILGYDTSCIETGKIYQYKKRDNKSASEYFKKGCDIKNADGCFYLAAIYEDSNKEMAKKFYKKACKLKHRVACMRYRRLK